jgi:hypothetical protein
MFIIKLSPQDLFILREALDASKKIKLKKLQNVASRERMVEMYEDARAKLAEPIEVKNTTVNLFTWILDQLKHSGHLWDTSLCKNATAICQSCIRDEYEHFASIQVFDSLFEIIEEPNAKKTQQ